jgi:hypothetical protein
MADDPPEPPRLYLIPADESQARTEVLQRWKQARAAALAVLVDRFTADASAYILEAVIELEGIQTRYMEEATRLWCRTAQVAYERGQKDGIRALAIMEEVASEKSDTDADADTDPPPTPPDTLH